GRFREPLELQILPSTHSLRKLQAMQARLERVLLERLVELSRLVDRIERLRARREMKISEVSHARASLLYATSNLTLCQDLLAIIERESRQAADQLEEERTLHDKLDEQRRALENRLSSLKRGRDLRSEVARLEKALAKAREDIAALTRTLKVDLYPKLEATKGKLSVTRRGIEVNRKRLEEMGLLLKEANESLTALREEKRMIGGELQGMERSAAELRLKLSSVNNRLEAVRETKNELISRKGRLYTDIALARQRLGSLTEQLYELGFKEPIAVSPEDVKRAEALRERLEAELTDIGAINYLAAKHYHEQMGKYKLISERINDLERDKRAILDFIERLEKEKRRVFTDAFTRVARRFSEFFAKITANGRGFLKLQDEENPLNGDIDMLIQLPGKSTISVSGASGGEKSIAVVSFILALGDLMRAPLYIFDEIDVHLDQFHVERLADVLKERSRSFQIIIVSRRSPVLAKADKVYGFFMQNDRSYVVSLPAQVTA
ncbi:TPA: hypothetical protein EYP44_05730, partial [Candidatus Bathyarchaeota archaeon]|nr:hypothetical protein [Candidatus Bathyarchaeota archaeon]